jgi:hypothetical protein
VSRARRGHGQAGAIQLEYEARAVDRLVFLSHRVSERAQIFFLAGVVPVRREDSDDTRGGGAHERGRRGNPFRSRLEVLDVGLHGALPDIPDRPIARRESDLRRRGHGLGHLLGEVREVVQAHHRCGDLFDRALSAEAGQPVLDIGGIAGLAHLTVVEHVDARVGLPLHGLPHRCPHLGPELRVIDRLACLCTSTSGRNPAGRGRLPECVVKIRPVRGCVGPLRSPTGYAKCGHRPARGLPATPETLRNITLKMDRAHQDPRRIADQCAKQIHAKRPRSRVG